MEQKHERKVGDFIAPSFSPLPFDIGKRIDE
jgi:hypothetical protein